MCLEALTSVVSPCIYVKGTSFELTVSRCFHRISKPTLDRLLFMLRLNSWIFKSSVVKCNQDRSRAYLSYKQFRYVIFFGCRNQVLNIATFLDALFSVIALFC